MPFLFVIGLFISFSTSAMAMSCYSRAEAEAEQGLRIQSELMVIGLNCQHMTPRGWKNFYAQYQEISNKHSDLFFNYEQILITHFGREGANNPKRALDDLRTDLANKVSYDAAQMRPDIFCATYAPRIPKVAGFSDADFRHWAGNFNPNHPVSKPICE